MGKPRHAMRSAEGDTQKLATSEEVREALQKEEKAPPRRRGRGGGPLAEEQKPSMVPNRKILAVGTGNGLAAQVLIVATYLLPDVPGVVVAATVGISVTLIGLLFGYQIPEEK